MSSQCRAAIGAAKRSHFVKHFASAKKNESDHNEVRTSEDKNSRPAGKRLEEFPHSISLPTATECNSCTQLSPFSTDPCFRHGSGVGPRSWPHIRVSDQILSDRHKTPQRNLHPFRGIGKDGNLPINGHPSDLRSGPRLFTACKGDRKSVV